MKAILKVLRFSSLLHGYSAWGGEQNGSNSDFFLLLNLHTPPGSQTSVHILDSHRVLQITLPLVTQSNPVMSRS